ncbi:hypothetical protein ACHAWF_013658 [Thalassiosira exigua]
METATATARGIQGRRGGDDDKGLDDALGRTQHHSKETMKLAALVRAASIAAVALLRCRGSSAFAPASYNGARFRRRPLARGVDDEGTCRRAALRASSSSLPPPSRDASRPSPPSSLRARGGESDEADDAAVPPPTSPRRLSLYNSLTLTKDPLVPLAPPAVTMYTCGPTVYDSAHVGNFRAFLTYDVLKRVLTYLGYDVDHVCNLTDVDDKIIKRCDREGVGLLELTRAFESKFFEDLEALNIVKARAYPRATDHIDEMARLIVDLERNGLAYQSDEGSWYFAVSKKEGYGTRLVQLDPEQLKKGASVETGGGGAQRGMDADEYDADKEGVRDFCLWKAYKPGFDREDATWDPVVELEGGEAKRGANCAPFCNCWIHNGFVNIGDEKMSKSKGNFLTLRRACPTSDDVRAYRYLVVSSQYRNPLSFTDAALGAAKGALKRLDRVKVTIDEALSKGDDVVDASAEGDSDIVATVERELGNFRVAIADDLSMPRASASLFSIVKSAEKEFKRVAKAAKDSDGDESGVAPLLDLVGLERVRRALDEMDQVFGIYYEVPAAKGESSDGEESSSDGDSASVPEDVMDLVVQRSAAKDAKDWELADSLRSKITELGFSVKDVKGGDPIVSRV